MRFIKTFEDISEEEYKINDYILLDMEQIEIENTKIGITAKNPQDDIAQIISISRSNSGTVKSDEYPFFIKFYNDIGFYVKKDEISRHLTAEEIKEFERKKSVTINQDKYNL